MNYLCVLFVTFKNYFLCLLNQILKVVYKLEALVLHELFAYNLTMTLCMVFGSLIRKYTDFHFKFCLNVKSWLQSLFYLQIPSQNVIV